MSALGGKADVKREKTDISNLMSAFGGIADEIFGKVDIGATEK